MQKPLYKQLYAQFYRGNIPIFALAIFAALASGSLNLILSWIIGQLIDTASGAAGAMPLTVLIRITGGFVLLCAVLFLLKFASEPRFIARAMEQYKDFDDVSDGYWAAEYIKAAAKSGWINGYEDGSFRADRNISRAEVVTIVNRLLGREADESYIADNLRKLNTFSDMSGKHWAYYAVMEAANAHTAILGENETWSK